MFGRGNRDRRRAAAEKRDAAIAGLRDDLVKVTEREERIDSLVARFERHAETARNAVDKAAQAQEERDEYRRVLAASIAAEHRANEQLEKVDRERIDAHSKAAERESAAARLEGERAALEERVQALEAMVREQGETFERSLADVQDRAWSERDAARAELMRLTGEARQETSTAVRDVAREVVSELERRTPPGGVPPQALEITGMRRRLLVGLGLGAGAVGIGLVPTAILGAIDGEREMYVHLASGLHPLQILGFAALAFALSAGLLTLARRDALVRA